MASSRVSVGLGEPMSKLLRLLKSALRHVLLGAFLVVSGCAPGDFTSASYDPDEVALQRGNLRSYPWPPERPSTQAILTEAIKPAIGHSYRLVASALSLTLRRSGYGDHSFYAAPNGFVVATRLEAVNLDGEAYKGSRRYYFPVRPGVEVSSTVASLAPMLEPGNWRYIAFVLTDQPIIYSTETLTGASATELALDGSTSLDELYNSNPIITPEHTLIALIYEFTALGDPVRLTLRKAGMLSGDDHMTATGLRKLLELGVQEQVSEADASKAQ